MESLDVFDLSKNRFHVVKTEPDAEHGFPRQRKGHAVVQRGRMVYVFGGTFVNYLPDSQSEKLWSSVWTLDLETLKWNRYLFPLPNGVFFHAAAITNNGQVLSYGGCITCLPGPERTDDVVSFHVDVPSLLWSAVNAVVKSKPDHFARIPGIATTLPRNVFNRAVLSDAQYFQELEARDLDNSAA